MTQPVDIPKQQNGSEDHSTWPQNTPPSRLLSPLAKRMAKEDSQYRPEDNVAGPHVDEETDQRQAGDPASEGGQECRSSSTGGSIEGQSADGCSASTPDLALEAPLHFEKKRSPSAYHEAASLREASLLTKILFRKEREDRSDK